METHLCKIFVGNVPFQCSQFEFQKCFEKMDGFIKAEIICRQGTNISRGFGFVTFNNQKDAKKLLYNNTIILKDRTLRFTEYTMNKYTQNIQSYDNNPSPLVVQNKNYILVNNLRKDSTRDELYEIFSKYGEVGKYFILSDPDTGIFKNQGVIEIIDVDLYNLLLSQKTLNVTNSYVLELSKWKQQKQSFEKKITKLDLFKAFTAGKNVGMIEAQLINKIAQN